MERPAVAFSAPGKVLLAGGYLVLDRDFTGLVFGLDARIYVQIESLHTSEGVSLSEIVVKSPQFREAEWRYGYRETENRGGIEVMQLKRHSTGHQSRNKFVETSLAYALTYASAINSSKIGPAAITILADSDYYSSLGASGFGSSSNAKRFVDFDVPLHDAHKTGLGSSAALVTALIAAIVDHYVPRELLNVMSEPGKSRIHNLAQIAHCAAQGKVGSGFDVAAAVHGSCVYRRFSPSILEGIGDVGAEGFAERLNSVIDDSGSTKRWDTDINKSAAALPSGLRLLMCDVDCGSETVGMVKKVLAWRKEQPEEARLLWATLQSGNEDLIRELQTLRSKAEHSRVIFDDLGDIIVTIRTTIREMSQQAGVPIEPKVQTDLIDACCKLNGVVGGVVPGAGGYDAIALVVVDQESVIQNLRDLLADYEGKAQDGQGLSIGKIRLLNVKQDNQGLKIEDSSVYRDWKQNVPRTAHQKA